MCFSMFELLEAFLPQLCDSCHFQPIGASVDCVLSMFELLEAFLSKLCDNCHF